MRFAYADPPYPGKAHLYPEGREVDHRALVRRLCRDYPDGWALSTSAEALRMVLQLCPADVRVAAWVKSPRRARSARALNAWEPVILWRGRLLDTDAAQDLLDVCVARGRHRAYPGALVGMKPPEFAEWTFRQLGARPGDELVDLFPGSGAVSRAWARFVADPSLELRTTVRTRRGGPPRRLTSTSGDRQRSTRRNADRRAGAPPARDRGARVG